jgi:peroxiredoxin Q/BCP
MNQVWSFCFAGLVLGSTPLACKKAESNQGKPPAATKSKQSQLLKPGNPVPDVHATSHEGEAVSLAALRGKSLVVYFYPKDDTPGCTVEAQELRDLHAEIEKSGAIVIGVSTDDAASHQAFAAKHALPFLLLPDTDGRIASQFGVPLNNGRARRVTFVIGKDGLVKKVFPQVRPSGHGREVLDALTAATG